MVEAEAPSHASSGGDTRHEPYDHYALHPLSQHWADASSLAYFATPRDPSASYWPVPFLAVASLSRILWVLSSRMPLSASSAASRRALRQLHNLIWSATPLAKRHEPGDYNRHKTEEYHDSY